MLQKISAFEIRVFKWAKTTKKNQAAVGNLALTIIIPVLIMTRLSGEDSLGRLRHVAAFNFSKLASVYGDLKQIRQVELHSQF